MQIKFLWASEESGFRHLYLIEAARIPVILQIKFLWASEESGFRHLYLVVAAISRDSSPPDSTLIPR